MDIVLEVRIRIDDAELESQDILFELENGDVSQARAGVDLARALAASLAERIRRELQHDDRVGTDVTVQIIELLAPDVAAALLRPKQTAGALDNDADEVQPLR